MKKNKKALSLMIAISITLLMSLLALYILEYIIPFSKDTKNIEQAVVAYYQADSGIENALLNDTDKSIINPKKDYSISILKDGYILPPVGQGNSEYDKNYNIIRTGKPIQLEIGKGAIKNFDNFKVFFKVPDLNKNSQEDLAGGNLKIVNWQLSSKTDSLDAQDSQIKADEIDGDFIILKDRIGRRVKDDSLESFETFYNTNCSADICKLKLSVINNLKLDNGTNIPYLEWKITTDDKIPLRYKIIDTTGKSYGFQKKLRVKVPQQTTNQAFDFAVSQ